MSVPCSGAECIIPAYTPSVRPELGAYRLHKPDLYATPQ
jgi:hypothetical protein